MKMEVIALTVMQIVQPVITPLTVPLVLLLSCSTRVGVFPHVPTAPTLTPLPSSASRVLQSALLVLLLLCVIPVRLAIRSKTV